MARRTKEDAQATRTALLDAAERVFQQRGVSRTSLNEIAQAAGVTRGALYWHFKDKAALFNAMMERVTLPLETALVSVASEECAVHCEPLSELRRGLSHALGQIANDPQTRRVLQIATMMVEHVEELGPVRERHLQAKRDNVKRLGNALECASRIHGVNLPAPLSALAHSLHALMHGLVYDWLLEPVFDLQSTGLSALDIFLRGLGFPSAAPAH